MVLCLPWVFSAVLLAAVGFLAVQGRRLRHEWHLQKEVNHALQQNWMRECERRAIAEEKASRLQELEKIVIAKEELIAKLALEQGELKNLLTEKETTLSQQAHHQQEKFSLLHQAQERLTESFKTISAEPSP